jgi:hypothetical protein
VPERGEGDVGLVEEFVEGSRSHGYPPAGAGPAGYGVTDESGEKSGAIPGNGR